MNEVVLQRMRSDGQRIRAVFAPDQGMNLVSLTFGEVEVIDQSTKNLFDEKLGGYGPLIGPHFYHRKDIPQVPDETVFPHISRVKAGGGNEPFSHGIGRYVPWNYTASDMTIDATLSGMDTYAGVTLAALEGFDFKMHYKARLHDDGLHIDYHVESENSPSIAGLHYYYALENNSGVVRMKTEDQYNDMGVKKAVPAEWKDENGLRFDMKEESDYTFWPQSENHCSGEARLESGKRNLVISYETDSDQNAFQLYHPKDASFVCIEPVTAKDPRAANQKKNSLKVRINLL